MNKADFFNKYRGLFQYDDYASTEENTALKSFILRADTDSALNSVPEPLQSTWKSSPADTLAPASFGTTTVESNDKRMQLTTTGGITPRSPRSLQLLWCRSLVPSAPAFGRNRLCQQLGHLRDGAATALHG